MSSYSRSWRERIQIQLEIMWEGCVDTIGHYADYLRTPLLFLAGVAVLMTLRSARKGISLTKNRGYSAFGSGTPWNGGSSSSYAYPNYRSPTAGTSSYNGNSQYGYANAKVATNGIGTSSSYLRGGGTPASMGTAVYGGGFGNNGGAMGGNTHSTAQLVDMHGSNVQVVQGDFKDYGGVLSFSGPIETISAIESPSVVEQALRSPGQGRVLIVDGGGSQNAAIFDSNMVRTAQQSGWKGVIINGVVRNADSLATLPLGIKAIGTHPVKGQQTMGQTGVPLSFAGVNFSPGNYVYADKDGIVVSQTSLGSGVAAPAYGTTSQYGATTGNIGGASGGYGATSQYGATTGNIGGASGGYGGMQQPRSAYGSQQRMGTTGSYAGNPGYPQTSNYGATASVPGSSQYSMPSSFGRSPGSSPYGSQSYGSSYYNSNRRKKPSKQKLIGLLLMICAFVWCCLGE